MIGIAALVVGIVLGPGVPPQRARGHRSRICRSRWSPRSTRCSAGCGRTWNEIFDAKVFVVSFVFNVLVAALIVCVGDQLGVGTQLSTAIIVVLGIRIFGNAAALRRRLFGA